MKRPVTTTLSKTNSTARPRPTLAAAGVLSVALLAACSTQSPMQTQVPYQPADGVAARSGVVEARNLLVVSAKKDAAGLVSGSLINTSVEPVTVSILSREEAEAGTAKGTVIQLKGREQKRLDSVQLAKVAGAPGDMTDIVIQTSAGQTQVSVPVLLPNGPYASLTPTASTTAAG